MYKALHNVYERLLPFEYRYSLYKLRHQKEFDSLLNQVNVHDKGIFSLTGFTRSKTIFIHITKTAGTSVATSLYGMLPYHYTGVHYRVIFGKEKFNSYYKFAFVRNPWSRLYSAYTYLKAGGWDEKDEKWASDHLANIDSFEDFACNWLDENTIKLHIHFKPQHEFLLDHRGKLLINDLGYFESIQDDYRKFSAKVEGSKTLGHKNPTNRSRQSYQQAYSEKSKARVAELYKTDIELFGYSFDGYQRKRVINGKLVNEK